jgi:capsular polysaccharide biosynthesis protein
MRAETSMYARAVRGRWAIIAAVVVTSLLAAQFFTARETPLYRAVASATVAPAPNLTESGELQRSLETLERRTVVATFVLIAGARETKLRAASAARIDTADVHAYRVSASVAPSSNVIRIQVEGADPQRASDLANSISQVTGIAANQLYRLFAIQPLDASIPPLQPAHPNGKRNAVVAAILGLFIGLVVAVGVEALALVPAQANQQSRQHPPLAA